MSVDIFVKPPMYSKIIGNCGENIISNWLCRSGFEVAIVDHTGVDIVAYNRSADMRIGCTVKSRGRAEVKREHSNVHLFKSSSADRTKLLEACKAFACEPWIAVYVEAKDFADIYLTSLANYDKKYCSQKAVVYDSWNMTSDYKDRYKQDKDVHHIHIVFQSNNWWPKQGE